MIEVRWLALLITTAYILIVVTLSALIVFGLYSLIF